GNKPDTHIKNINYDRDFQADMVVDIALVRAGEGCPHCEGKLSVAHGIEVGHIFKLGTFFSETLDAFFIDEKGVSRPIVMGCYGIGLGRLLAATIEQNHDDKGVIWPRPIAPYQIYLCPLYREDTKVAEIAEKLYDELEAAGLEVLFDDRVESPGVKFNDADLLGIPVRVAVSPRTLEKDSVEMKKRAGKDAELVPLIGASTSLKEIVES
ncbi:MAG: His/Gly/Thr/Pro-type tRNA ligase C-terminal domain-containing protein, partial [Dehalococcoidales bacterium]|nr:His/Gly/Thr/Pro-type tRNA ligase C-terminal domain-containing protein [Dehalococcoidales bacterium]